MQRFKGVKSLVLGGFFLYAGCLAANEGFGVISPMENARRILEEEDLEQSLAEDRVEAKFYAAFGGFKNDMVKPRASKVHDRVTFVIDETTESEITANTELTSETESIWNLNNWFNLTKNANGDTQVEPYSMKTSDGSINTTYNTDDYAQLNMNTKHEHDGEGNTTRSNTLKTKLSGEIIQVLPNGNLVVEAKKTVTINNESQVVTLLGTVDPDDLNENSEVSNEKIMDLSIKLTGSGDVSDTIRQGWFAKFVNKFKPF